MKLREEVQIIMEILILIKVFIQRVPLSLVVNDAAKSNIKK